MKQHILTRKIDHYDIPRKLREADVYPFFRVIESEQDTTVQINGRKVLMFGSNSYLGLTNHPKLVEASKKALEKYGTGCAGSRFLNGTLDIHLELEEKLAAFVGKEDALVFSTGYQVNLGVISALISRNDYLIIDEYDHASIYDGCRLSYGKTIRHKHNDPNSLEDALKKIPYDELKLVVTEGIFSMEGDISKLPEINALAKKYNAILMVDDAHGLGVLGANGKGTANHFGLTNDVDLIMGTFSKSLASIGGFIASDRDTIDFLKHKARSLMFSASPSPASIACVIAAIEIMQQEPERIEKLWDNTRHAISRLKAAGFDLGNSASPIIPIMIRDDIKTYQITKELLEQNVFVNPVASPAVPSNGSLIRFSIMATHSISQIDEALDKIISISEKYNVLTEELLSDGNFN